MTDFEQLIKNARENTCDDKELSFIAAIERRGSMSPDDERRLWEIADR
jgi:hypothetical protein